MTDGSNVAASQKFGAPAFTTDDTPEEFDHLMHRGRIVAQVRLAIRVSPTPNRGLRSAPFFGSNPLVENFNLSGSITFFLFRVDHLGL